MVTAILKWFEKRINPFPKGNIEINEKEFWPFIYACLAGSRKWLVILMLFTALIGAFEGLLFQFVGSVVDWLSNETPQTLWQNNKKGLLLIIALIAISPILVFVSSSLRFQTIQGVLPMRLRWLFHQKMLAQSLGFYQDEFAGRVSAKVMQTALAVREVVMVFADMVVYLLIYFFTIGLILINFNPFLLLPFALWILLFALILIIYIPKLSKTSQEQADARSLMTGRITDAYSNISTVKLFSHASKESSYAKEAMQEFLDKVLIQMRLVNKLQVCNFSNSMLLIGSTIFLGLYLWQAQLASVGALAAATAMALRLNGLSQWVLWQSASLFESIGTVKDGIVTLSQPQTIFDQDNAVDLVVDKGQIDFNHISFNYKGTKTVFDDLSFSIKPGERIGIVGRSGAGKSTIVNLLLRFYDVTQGGIFIDGQNIKDVTQQSLRSQIGMVTQDTSLLHRSVRENIAYGKDDATEAEIIEAAKRAQADDFIIGLADKYGRTGYDTLVGERGTKLSGGQRQRIAIARVMLKNAPILLLDEATSALDSEVEMAIQDSLYDLMDNKTVIAIAHRLSTIAAMDRLIILDKGKIVEMGSHQDLLAQNGLYAQLWSRQSGGFLPESLS